MNLTADTSDLQVLAKRLSDKPELQKAISPYFKQASMDLFALAFRDAPNKTGHLSRSLEIDFPSQLTSIIGTNGTCKYFDFVYLGTRPHKIEAKRKKSLMFGSPDAIFRKSVMHPGTKPNPFLYRTYLWYKDIFLKRMTEAYVEVIDKETKV